LCRQNRQLLIDKYEIDLWKAVSKHMKESYPDEYIIIDWEQEEKENLIWMWQISKEELLF
jgi:hypothetical protein